MRILGGERRFVIPVSATGKFIDFLNSFLKRKQFSSGGITQTLYFLNKDLSNPQGNTLRARRYDAVSLETQPLRADMPFNLEVKRWSIGREKTRDKTTLSLPFGEIKEKLASSPIFPIGKEGKLVSFDPVYPVIAVEYNRQHFVWGDFLRLTLDQNIRYWDIHSQDNQASLLGAEPGVIVEVKYGPQWLSSPLMMPFLENFFGFHPQVTVSKRSLALNLIRKIAKGNSPALAKIKNKELELKFNVLYGDVFLLLQRIKDLFRVQKEVYTIGNNGWTISKNGVMLYVSCETVPQSDIKFDFRGSNMKWVVKGMNRQNSSIMIRDELKSPLMPYEWEDFCDIIREKENELGADMFIFPAIERYKRSFYIRTTTGNVFQISGDNSELNTTVFNQRLNPERSNDQFSQIEIEYVGTVAETNSISLEIIYKEIEGLANIIKQQFSRQIMISNLTKYDWLAYLNF